MKYFLFFLLVAIITSGWWAFGVFDIKPLLALNVPGSIGILFIVVFSIMNDWD
jgi:hypothetical protein